MKYVSIQRILDIFLSGFAILILLPLFILCSFILKLTGEGEILYKQIRVGKNGNYFELLKFATMLKNSPNIGAGEITVKNDSRVLPMGKFLRKSKINELPQLWNIFIGNMSIVGPRPMVPSTYAHYPKVVCKKLNTLKPGLTGIGSIYFRNEEHYLASHDNPMEFYIDQIMPVKINLELWFLENNSLWLYLKIIFVTAWVVIFPSSKIADKAFIGAPRMPKNFN